MNKFAKVFLSITLFFFLFLETGGFQLPLSLLFLLVFFAVTKSERAFLLAFFIGLLLDTLLIRTLGLTSLFFVVFLFLIHLYERKYEIKTLPFVLIALFFGVGIYGLLFDYHLGIIPYILTLGIGGLFFVFLQKKVITNAKR